MKTQIAFTLNNELRKMDVETNQTLADALRYLMGTKSVKCGCERGDCGSCTILFNGKSVRSCLILALEADGQEITTLEGIKKPEEEMTPLQEKLLANNSFQCGFCASGMIMSLTPLLKKNPSPSEEEIKEAIAGNLCRCTGYEPIISAVKELAKENRQQKEKSK